MPVFGIAALGSALLLLVVWLTLGLDPVNIGGAFGVVMLAAACFTAIAHLLRTWLGVVGSAIMLVLLMVQLTSCGGLYPMETAPAPFQAISRFMPMTYLVDAPAHDLHRRPDGPALVRRRRAGRIHDRRDRADHAGWCTAVADSGCGTCIRSWCEGFAGDLMGRPLD